MRPVWSRLAAGPVDVTEENSEFGIRPPARSGGGCVELVDIGVALCASMAQVSGFDDAGANPPHRHRPGKLKSGRLRGIFACTHVQFGRRKKAGEDVAVEEAVAFQVDTYLGWILAVDLDHVQLGPGRKRALALEVRARPAPQLQAARSDPHLDGAAQRHVIEDPLAMIFLAINNSLLQ